MRKNLHDIILKEEPKKQHLSTVPKPCPQFIGFFKLLRICLITVFSFIFCFKKQFYIFETKKLVWQLKMDKKQKLFSKLNL